MKRAQTTHDHRQTVGHGLDVAPKNAKTKPNWKKEEPQDIIKLSKPTYQGNQGLGRLKGNDTTVSSDIACGMWATQEWGKKIGMDQVGERRHGIPHSQPTHSSLGPTNVQVKTISTGRGHREHTRVARGRTTCPNTHARTNTKARRWWEERGEG